MDSSTIRIRIVEAKNLAPMDKSGTSDPYCRLKCSFNKQRFKTKVVEKTLSPKWDESFKFFTLDPPEGTITIKLWDKDRWTTDDFMGELVLDVKQIASPKDDKVEKDQWFTIGNEPKKKGTPEKGSLHLLITYDSGKPSPSSVSSPSTPLRTEIPPSASANDAHPSGEKLEDKYDVGKEIGRGGFSVVKRGKNKASGLDVAIKCINKKTLKKEELQLLGREINIMKKLQHKNIVQLFDLYETQTDLFLILEFIPGGELFEQIVERGSYSEHDAANIIRQILEGIDYMHKHGVVHRDLKPENLLCATLKTETNKPTIIKIADFGLSKDIESGTMSTSCGTPSYVAPEVLLGGSYDNEVDIWSIGVITYVLLCGFTPFYGDNQRQLFERILHAQFDFPSPEWDDISPSAKDFIKRMLVVNPATRLTANQALAHEWIQREAPKRDLKSFGSVRDGIQKLKQAPVVK